MNDYHPLMQSYKSLIADRTVTLEDYFSRQKEILKEGIALLKEEKHPDVDYVVGSIALVEGDKYNIPLKSALGYLNRSFQNGHMEAGLSLASALRGAVPQVPEEFVNKEKALEILTQLSEAGHAKAKYELSSYYLDQIIYTVDGGGYAPEKWFDFVQKYALESIDGGFIGGYIMLGFLHSNGFGNHITQNHKEAFIYFQKAIELFTGNPEEEGFLSDAKQNLGGLYYDGLGVARDRRKGLALIREAADLGNQPAQEWFAMNYDLLVKEGLIDSGDDIVSEDFNDFDVDKEFAPSPAPQTSKDVRTRH